MEWDVNIDNVRQGWAPNIALTYVSVVDVVTQVVVCGSGPL